MADTPAAVQVAAIHPMPPTDQLVFDGGGYEYTWRVGDVELFLTLVDGEHIAVLLAERGYMSVQVISLDREQLKLLARALYAAAQLDKATPAT